MIEPRIPARPTPSGPSSTAATFMRTTESIRLTIDAPPTIDVERRIRRYEVWDSNVLRPESGFGFDELVHRIRSELRTHRQTRDLRGQSLRDREAALYQRLLLPGPLQVVPGLQSISPVHSGARRKPSFV